MNTNETYLNPLDDAPADAMEDIFVLPEEVASNERISRWYNEMVVRLRREAQGVPMKTAQYLLMERIAYSYAKMRYEEFTNPDLPERQRMALQDAWQKMLDQFNRLLEKHNDKVVNEMLLRVHEILKEALPIISDPIERANLRRKLQEDFANIDM